MVTLEQEPCILESTLREHEFFEEEIFRRGRCACGWADIDDEPYNGWERYLAHLPRAAQVREIMRTLREHLEAWAGLAHQGYGPPAGEVEAQLDRLLALEREIRPQTADSDSATQ